MANIFIITVLSEARERPFARLDGTVGTNPTARDRRSWGWYGAYEAALDAVHRNLSDLHETLYDYAVIEEAEEGVPAEVVAERWFRFDHDAKGYRPCDKPVDLVGQCNFGFG